MRNFSSPTVPVGSVFAYAGTDPYNLGGNGWLVCAGAAVFRYDYGEMFDAIKTAYGAPDQATFNIPDFRGYFLRGVDRGSQRDPSTETRFAPRRGANAGDLPGSAQSFATQVPSKHFQVPEPFKANVEHLPPGDYHRAYKGTSAKISKYNGGSVAVETTGGGDDESRPINKYVFFIIKSNSVDRGGQPVALPVGTVVPFAGRKETGPQNNFLICDGAGISRVGVYKDLYDAIGIAHGGDGDPNYNIPDYRGYFLRGVADGQITDPNRGTRQAPFADRPPQTSGNSGDAVGSEQSWATALPKTPFITRALNLPTDAYMSDTALGNKSTYHNDGSTYVETSTEGGDSETRPTNVSVHWYIKFR